MNTVNCKICGTETSSTGTQLCDQCWEFNKVFTRFLVSGNADAIAYIQNALDESRKRTDLPTHVHTHQNLLDLIAAMPRSDLVHLAESVFLSLYGRVGDGDDDTWTIDTDKEWGNDVCWDVADDLYSAGLEPFCNRDRVKRIHPGKLIGLTHLEVAAAIREAYGGKLPCSCGDDECDYDNRWDNYEHLVERVVIGGVLVSPPVGKHPNEDESTTANHPCPEREQAREAAVQVVAGRDIWSAAE